MIEAAASIAPAHSRGPLDDEAERFRSVAAGEAEQRLADRGRGAERHAAAHAKDGGAYDIVRRGIHEARAESGHDWIYGTLPAAAFSERLGDEPRHSL